MQGHEVKKKKKRRLGKPPLICLADASTHQQDDFGLTTGVALCLQKKSISHEV